MNYPVDFIQGIRKRMLTLGHFDLAFLLFSAQELFALMCALIIFELLGLFGILLDTITLLVAIVFDRLFGRILGKVLRKNLALVFYLIFQISIFGLIGIVGIGLARTPIQTMYGSLGFGLWASIVCSLQSYHILMSLQEAYRLGLDLEKLEKAFVQLPDMFRKNQHVLEGYMQRFM